MDAHRPNVYRMRPESAVYAFFSLCFVALGLFGAIEQASDPFPFGLLSLAVAWSAAAFLGFRMARLAVYVEDGGIRVRNPLATKQIPWSEVRGFLLHRSLLGEFGTAELHDGGSVRLWGIQPRSPVASGGDRRAELAVGRLNSELQAARRAGPSLRERSPHSAQVAPGTPSAEHS
jgi:hypothetical protein